jgi:hypothetical protein
MYNEGDTASANVANKLSKSIANNGYVPQRQNRANNGYIGELNHVKETNRISILGEFGYFNKAEIVKICSDQYVNYVSDKVAESIYEQLREMGTVQQASIKTEEVAKVEQPVQAKEEPKEIKITIGDTSSVDKAEGNIESLQQDLDNLNTTLDNLNKTIEELNEISVKVSENVVTIDRVDIPETDVVVINFR